MEFFDLCFGGVHGIYKTSEMGNKKKTKKTKIQPRRRSWHSTRRNGRLDEMEVNVWELGREEDWEFSSAEISSASFSFAGPYEMDICIFIA
jgi:hypothetical protein